MIGVPFVKINYQETYSKAGDDLDVYKSLLLITDGSLAKSRFYDSAVSDLGGEEKIENSSTFLMMAASVIIKIENNEKYNQLSSYNVCINIIVLEYHENSPL